MTKTHPPEYLPVRILHETADLSASIHERTGIYGRYYFAEIAHRVMTTEGTAVNSRMFHLDELPALAELAKRTYREQFRLATGPAQQPLHPEHLN